MYEVLDKGYVRYVDKLGTDLSVVNAARVSYDKEAREMGDSDRGLIRFLAEHGHMSPFRHAQMQFEIKAPLFVARQWWKYVVGSDHTMDAWNEASRRYITMEPEFYIPDKWRLAPENSKQGSGENMNPTASWGSSQALEGIVQWGMNEYDNAISMGMAPEMARLFLPAYGMYTKWRWTASLQSVAHFLNQRLADDAQKEIQQYAEKILFLAQEQFPVTIEALIEEDIYEGFVFNE